MRRELGERIEREKYRKVEERGKQRKAVRGEASERCSEGKLKSIRNLPP